MAYSKNHPGGWRNFPNITTPVRAQELDHIEDGVAQAHAALDGRLSEANLNATYVRGSAVVFQSPEPPDLSGLPAGTEYMWWKTDGNGIPLDLLTGVKA